GGSGLLNGLKRGTSSSPNVIVSNGVNPFDIAEELNETTRGADHLSFSNDGLRLFTDRATWEVATGYKVVPPRALPAFDPMNPQAFLNAAMNSVQRGTTTGAMALSPDNRWVARVTGRLIRIVDATTER